jgi:hypothetical protein
MEAFSGRGRMYGANPVVADEVQRLIQFQTRIGCERRGVLSS